MTRPSTLPTGLVCAGIGSAGGIVATVVLPWQQALLMPITYFVIAVLAGRNGDESQPAPTSGSVTGTDTNAHSEAES